MGKRIISIIVDTSGASRQYLITPFFELLQRDPRNEIFIYTRNMRLKEKHRFRNVHFRRFKYMRGIGDSSIILLSGWQGDLLEVLVEAKRKGTKTLAIQESAGSPSGGYSRDNYPDALCVWGEVSKQEYVKNGLPAELIYITGQPRFDLYFDVKKESSFGTERKVLLFATQSIWRSIHFPGGEEVIRRQYDYIYDAAGELNLRLICKLHPSDKRELYEREGVLVLEDTGVSKRNVRPWYCNNGYDPTADDLKRLGQIFKASDVATTLFSTTGLEIMSCGRPVIYFDMERYHRNFDILTTLRERCDFCWAETKEEFRGHLERYLNNPNADCELREKVVADFLYKRDGQASQRVLETIYELIHTDGHR